METEPDIKSEELLKKLRKNRFEKIPDKEAEEKIQTRINFSLKSRTRREPTINKIPDLQEPLWSQEPRSGVKNKRIKIYKPEVIEKTVELHDQPSFYDQEIKKFMEYQMKLMNENKVSRNARIITMELCNQVNKIREQMKFPKEKMVCFKNLQTTFRLFQKIIFKVKKLVELRIFAGEFGDKFKTLDQLERFTNKITKMELRIDGKEETSETDENHARNSIKNFEKSVSGYSLLEMKSAEQAYLAFEEINQVLNPEFRPSRKPAAVFMNTRTFQTLLFPFYQDSLDLFGKKELITLKTLFFELANEDSEVAINKIYWNTGRSEIMENIGVETLLTIVVQVFHGYRIVNEAVEKVEKVKKPVKHEKTELKKCIKQN